MVRLGFIPEARGAESGVELVQFALLGAGRSPSSPPALLILYIVPPTRRSYRIV